MNSHIEISTFRGRNNLERYSAGLHVDEASVLIEVEMLSST